MEERLEQAARSFISKIFRETQLFLPASQMLPEREWNEVAPIK
jgi:hypothetical protein